MKARSRFIKHTHTHTHIDTQNSQCSDCCSSSLGLDWWQTLRRVRRMVALADVWGHLTWSGFQRPNKLKKMPRTRKWTSSPAIRKVRSQLTQSRSRRLIQYNNWLERWLSLIRSWVDSEFWGRLQLSGFHQYHGGYGLQHVGELYRPAQWDGEGVGDFHRLPALLLVREGLTVFDLIWCTVMSFRHCAKRSHVLQFRCRTQMQFTCGLGKSK